VLGYTGEEMQNMTIVEFNLAFDGWQLKKGNKKQGVTTNELLEEIARCQQLSKK